jgi:hypothetical protein
LFAGLLPCGLKEAEIIELTEQQQQALDHGSEQPPRVRDPSSNEIYVLLPLVVFERLKGLLADDAHPRDAYAAIDRAFAEVWNDPKMDDYDRYEELKR